MKTALGAVRRSRGDRRIMDYKSFSVKELEALLHDEQKRFKKLIKEGRNVDMTRGRPAKEQLARHTTMDSA